MIFLNYVGDRQLFLLIAFARFPRFNGTLLDVNEFPCSFFQIDKLQIIYSKADNYRRLKTQKYFCGDYLCIRLFGVYEFMSIRAFTVESLSPRLASKTLRTTSFSMFGNIVHNSSKSSSVNISRAKNGIRIIYQWIVTCLLLLNWLSNRNRLLNRFLSLRLSNRSKVDGQVDCSLLFISHSA